MLRIGREVHFWGWTTGGDVAAKQLPVKNYISKHFKCQKSAVYLSEASLSTQWWLDQEVLLAGFTLYAGNPGATDQMNKQHTMKCTTATGTTGHLHPQPGSLSHQIDFVSTKTRRCYSTHSHTCTTNTEFTRRPVTAREETVLLGFTHWNTTGASRDWGSNPVGVFSLNTFELGLFQVRHIRFIERQSGNEVKCFCSVATPVPSCPNRLVSNAGRPI